ncbi:ferredoxin [Streptomyces sp. NPDC005969]|uniref:ferredoxin n=1 Tax=Streptomyces sp. NPDC005969 TaxID=3156722 RepID=UPI0033FBFD5F
MPYVITDACVDVMDKSCMEECPADCIQPDACVECGRREPVCPQISLCHHDLPAHSKHFEQVSAEFFTLGTPPLGSPGGARRTGRVGHDHPEVAA